MQKTNNEDWMLIIAVLAEGMDIATPGSQAVVLVPVSYTHLTLPTIYSV